VEVEETVGVSARLCGSNCGNDDKSSSEGKYDMLHINYIGITTIAQIEPHAFLTYTTHPVPCNDQP